MNDNTTSNHDIFYKTAGMMQQQLKNQGDQAHVSYDPESMMFTVEYEDADRQDERFHVDTVANVLLEKKTNENFKAIFAGEA